MQKHFLKVIVVETSIYSHTRLVIPPDILYIITTSSQSVNPALLGFTFHPMLFADATRRDGGKNGAIYFQKDYMTFAAFGCTDL